MRIITIAVATLLFSVSQPTAQAFNPGKPVRDFQLSLFPGVGTEGADVLNYRYKVSVNIFAGMTGGIEGLEAGGFLNLTHGNIRGLQVSGFANVVNGQIEGAQFAGFANATLGNHQGISGAGFVSLVTGNRQGLAGAGFINITGENHQGFSGAGFANITGGNYQGFSGSGFANVVGGNYQGFSGAGFANVIGGSYLGFAGAGFANRIGGHAEGAQLAGFANIVGGSVKGFQAAGFLNVAQRVEGIQLGFINISDTIAGVPIGFLSIVRNGGIRQFELSASDIVHLSVSYRIGVQSFYNIFSYNWRLFGDERFNSLGYGIGSSLQLSRQLGVSVEAHTTQMRDMFTWERTDPDMLNELRLNLGFRTNGPVELFAGLLFYNQVFKHLPEEGITGREIAPDRLLHERDWRDYRSIWWLGARGGLRVHLR